MVYHLNKPDNGYTCLNKQQKKNAKATLASPSKKTDKNSDMAGLKPGQVRFHDFWAYILA